MKLYQDISLFIHGFQDLVEFIDSGHNLIVAVLVCVAVESFGWICNQRVKEYVCDLTDGGADQCGFCGFIFGNSGDDFRIGGKLFGTLQQFYGRVVIIASSQQVGLVEQVRSRGVRHDEAVSLSGGFCFRTICICGDDNAAGGIRSFAVMLLPQKKKAGAKRADQCDAGCGSQKTGEPGWAPPAAVGPAGIVFMHM